MRLILASVLSLCLVAGANAQKNKKDIKDQFEILTIDSTSFTYYYWYKAEWKTEKKNEKINIMAEKKVLDSLSSSAITTTEKRIAIKQGDTYYKMTVKPLEKIRLDNEVVKTKKMIFKHEGRTITGAKETFYYSDCIDGAYIREKCIR
ncbi:MAG: hypothetical protein HY958_13405 [Bacteroidia bacterium]|nr:hypothetical protein [Bacteroidia bacterium]